MKKNKGFTMIEMLVTVAIIGIFMRMGFEILQKQTIFENKNFNNEVTLQTGVKTSIDKIKGTLKSSTQVHLVGKEVYYPNMDLTKLDDRYSYIAKVELNGVNTLANIIPNGKDTKFDIIPIVAENRNDENDKFIFDFKLYNGDKDFNKKLDKKLIKITIEGKNIDQKSNNEKKNFELTQDIAVPNANQIMLSKYLEGGIENVTAIAYDNKPLKIKSDTKLAMVFIFDNSGSMTATMRSMRLMKYIDNNIYYTLNYPWQIDGIDYLKIGGKRRYYKPYELTFPDQYYIKDKNGYDIGFPANDSAKREATFKDSFLAPRNYIVGNVFENTLMPSLNTLLNKNVDITIYAFGFNTNVTYNNIERSGKYLYPLNKLEQNKYGPYKINTSEERQKLIKLVKTDLKMSYQGITDPKGKTNTGMALLQGLEMLNQIKDIDNKFLIFLSDGRPQGYTKYEVKHSDGYSLGYDYVLSPDDKNPINIIDSHTYRFEGKPKNYANIMEEISDNSMDYIDKVTDKYQSEDTFTKAYLIGFSGVDKDKEKMGILPKKKIIDPNTGKEIEVEYGTVPSKSIRGYLSKGGKEVFAYDSFDREALIKSFDDIVNDIGSSIEVFDGPKRYIK